MRLFVIALLNIILLAACGAKTVSVRADKTLLRASTPAAQKEEPYDPPYVSKFLKQTKTLYVVVASDRTPFMTSPTHLTVKKVFADYRPQHVIFEDQGQAKSDCTDPQARNCTPARYAQNLAGDDRISFEPATSEKLLHTIEAGLNLNDRVLLVVGITQIASLRPALVAMLSKAKDEKPY